MIHANNVSVLKSINALLARSLKFLEGDIVAILIV